MFKTLLGFNKGKDFITEVLDEFKGMLDHNQRIFESSFGSLFNKTKKTSVGDKIYELDRRVNQAQKNIRRRIAEHLSLQPSVDTTVCLILMSVVKDAERVGDLAKNIYENRDYFDGPVPKDTYDKLFGDVDVLILELFNNTRMAFIDSNEEKATGSWDVQRRIRILCNDTLDAVSKSDLPVNQVVAFTLMTRYYKRIADAEE
jgi:phosphate uptake regulator